MYYMLKPKLRKLDLTCYACPSQWEGTDTDNGFVYIRFRYGVLKVYHIDKHHPVIQIDITKDNIAGMIELKKVLPLIKDYFDVDEVTEYSKCYEFGDGFYQSTGIKK